MMFQQIESNENFDLCRFRSLPEGRWEAGILKMGFGKARVRIALAKSGGWVPIDYWGGDHTSARTLLGNIIGICTPLPEAIKEADLESIFPHQNDKELGADFRSRLFKAGVQVRAIYGDFQQ
jgi:hypothetical protein